MGLAFDETASSAVVVDIGGSGVRLAAVAGGCLGRVERAEVGSLDDLAQAIRAVCPRPIAAVGLSVPGYVPAESGSVRFSRVAPYTMGRVGDKLARMLAVPRFAVMNDGEPHAQALSTMRGIELGAVCVGLGTAVSFGAIDSDGRILQSLSGESWDVGDMLLRTSASDPHVWWALGSRGLRELVERNGDRGYRRFGYRLGAFLGQVAAVPRPRTIGLSGGITRRHWHEFAPTAVEELSGCGLATRPRIVRVDYSEAALVGAARALGRI